LWSQETAAAYLAAMIDGEGTVTNSQGKRARQTRMVSISNTDPAIIVAITACCDVLGLTYRLRTDLPGRWPSKKPQWTAITHVAIHGRANFQRLLDIVPIQAPEKRRRLEVIAASYVDRVVVDPVDVRRLYECDGHTMQEVGALLGVGTKVIARLMREQGMRSRSHHASARGWITRRAHSTTASPTGS
jgi:G:T-mismatch repair DNA endonuclease (very short patch repair protein)